MRPLKSYDQILEHSEGSTFAGLQLEGLTLQESAEVLKQCVINRRAVSLSDSILEHLPPDVAYLVKHYDTDHGSVGNFRIGQIGKLQFELNAGRYSELFSDDEGNWYAFGQNTGRVGFFGWEWQPQDLIEIAQSTEKFLQITSAYEYADLPLLSSEEFSEVCLFLGMTEDNHYWHTLRMTGSLAQAGRIPEKKNRRHEGEHL